MAKVKVLIEGYTNEDGKGETDGEVEKTRATVTLVKDKDIVMVTDPGVLESQQVLIDALKKENLEIDDVNYVCLTHSHIDHYRNVGMFPKAKVLEFYGIWDKNTSEEWEEQFTEDIKIIKTPGHNKTSITLLVKTKKGTIAIVGDVFWKEGFPEKDVYADEHEKLIESREKVLELADYIIPGHADMYEVKK
jgi:glyoxylase-like metal-dependent hydrolase (beta-lactamase superfamily II)